MALATKY
jgi:hypothetical protein